MKDPLNSFELETEMTAELIAELTELHVKFGKQIAWCQKYVGDCRRLSRHHAELTKALMDEDLSSFAVSSTRMTEYLIPLDERDIVKIIKKEKKRTEACMLTVSRFRHRVRSFIRTVNRQIDVNLTDRSEDV